MTRRQGLAVGESRIVPLSWGYAEPEVGFEPTTLRLRVGCATTTPLGPDRGRTGRREGGVYRSG